VWRAPARVSIGKENTVSQQFKQDIGKAVLTALILSCLSPSNACGPSQSARTANATTEAQPTTVKRYPLTGRVVSIDQPNQSINIDGDEIPGFMGAMKMPYAVKEPGTLEKVSPGDPIKAEIVVGSDGAYLENVTVTTKARTPNK
jgi:protein SCO1